MIKKKGALIRNRTHESFTFGKNAMELRVLKYFVETAHEKSMTKAAANLHVTQPTLSRQLKALEEELGQKLFVRSNYHINLTEEGKLLLKRAEDILQIADKTSEEFASMQSFQGGDIYIGCAESEGIAYLAKTIKQLRSRYHNIRFHLYSGNAQSVNERLDQGLLDFNFIVQPLETAKYESLMIPFRDTWGLIMRKDALLVAKQTLTLDDLIDLPLIVSRQGIANEIPSWLKQKQDQLNIVATYDLIYNAAILVKEGIGYALSFDHLIHTGTDSILCFRPFDPPITSTMHLVWKKNQILSKSAQLFLAELKQLCEKAPL